ncbi:MAG: hypothetical protein WBA93_30950, partial [Microcoleaceae cyanobacterium]
SRMEKVMRELSDLRSFYVQLQKSRRESQCEGSAREHVAEAPSRYNQESVVSAKSVGNVDPKS